MAHLFLQTHVLFLFWKLENIFWKLENLFLNFQNIFPNFQNRECVGVDKKGSAVEWNRECEWKYMQVVTSTDVKEKMVLNASYILMNCIVFGEFFIVVWSSSPLYSRYLFSDRGLLKRKNRLSHFLYFQRK